MPLADPGETRRCEIRLDLAVPERIWRPHDPWQRLFVRTRLGSPRLWTAAEELLRAPDNAQRLDRQALSAVHELKTTGAAVRHALARQAQRRELLDGAASMALCERITDALEEVSRVRAQIEDSTRGDLAAEAKLAGEYISAEVLRLVTRVREGIAGEWPPRPSGKVRPVKGIVQPLMTLLKETFEAEAAWRQARGFVVPRASDRRSVERFMHRAGLLKRHFQRALFLDAQVNQIDDQVGNWVAAFVAILASTWYFVWQVYYLNEAMQVSQTLVSLFMAGAVAGLLYAVKDRIKELGRRYMSRLLKDLYADREVRLSLRHDGRNAARRLAIARETIRETGLKAADEHDGDLSGSQRYRVLHIRDVVTHRGGADLQQRGITCLKHILRYDLSALFSSVDDRAKSLAVPEGDRLIAVQSRRAYRLPVRARLYIDGAKLPIVERFGELIIRGRKLRGFRSRDDAANVWTAATD